MESKKDIQKTENISHFVDKQTIRTHPFGDNKMGERAYRRAERLVAAIHLLTNHIEADEPIRRTVRESSVSILADVLELRDEMRTVGSPKTHSIEASVRHLISLVRILAVSGFVSFENADVLTDALDDLGSFIDTSRRSVLSENIRLSREDLLDVRDTIKDRENIKDKSNIKDELYTRQNVQYIKDKDTEGESKSESSTEMSDTGGLNRPIDSDHRSNRRMEAVVEVLRSGTDMGIRDIAVNLPEYSEKMIQRELSELVALGRVRKVGLKRWSRYFLAAPGNGVASTSPAPSTTTNN